MIDPVLHGQQAIQGYVIPEVSKAEQILTQSPMKHKLLNKLIKTKKR